MANLDGTDNTFDSREVIARIAELTAEWEENTGDTASDFTLSEDDWSVGIGEDAAEEIVALIALKEEAADSIPDFEHGEQFINEDYFEQYSQELAESIGAIDPDAGWPLSHIDWEAAANSLKQDYEEFEFRGGTYFARH